MTRKVLAVASQGGHWAQLSELLPAFYGCEAHLVQAASGQISEAQIRHVMDCNRHTPIRATLCLIQLLWLMIALRPAFVVSTGALPGAIALGLGRMIGARTIWVDSAANAEALSQSGRLVRPVSDLHLTQWPEVAAKTGSGYFGSLF